MNRVFTISNILSMSRVVIVFPIALLLLSGNEGDRVIACGLILLGVVTDFLILAGAVYIRLSKRIVPQSNWPGKWAVTFIAGYMFLCILRIELFRVELLWASTFLMALSLTVYAQRLFIGRNIVSA
jgi:phosphatidylglycerophosphate synthase